MSEILSVEDTVALDKKQSPQDSRLSRSLGEIFFLLSFFKCQAHNVAVSADERLPQTGRFSWEDFGRCFGCSAVKQRAVSELETWILEPFFLL